MADIELPIFTMGPDTGNTTCLGSIGLTHTVLGLELRSFCTVLGLSSVLDPGRLLRVATGVVRGVQV
jgi:hypothetical protein